MEDPQLQQRPSEFVDLHQFVPTLAIDLRYASSDNFLGRQVNGYQQARCWLTQSAAKALSGVQGYLLGRGYSLLVFDAYRPQRAVDHFIKWSHEADDQHIKARYYPQLEKRELFERGFIASHSAHSRGSTLDLTIASVEMFQHGHIPEPDWEQRFGLDMGTHFDLFDERSFTNSANINTTQQHNRKFLLDVMDSFGFQNFSMEWWHFTYRGEPFPRSYFDFLP